MITAENSVNKHSISDIPLTAQLLSLSYSEFDQKPSNGWRILAEKGNYIEAGNLIVEYLSNHKELDIYQIANLRFHAGQMYAFANDITRAIALFNTAFLAIEPDTSPIRWNDYVTSTVAFLRNDKITLIECQEKISNNGREIHGEIPNLAMVEKMINNLDLSYSEMYHISATQNTNKPKIR